MRLTYCCTACDHSEVLELGLLGGFPKDCPKCGGRKTFVGEDVYRGIKGEQEAKFLRQFSKMRDEERRAVLLERGIETEWKAIDVGGLTSLLGGVAASDKIEMGLLDMTLKGWEFVFFCDSDRLVGGPILIFRRATRRGPSPGKG